MDKGKKKKKDEKGYLIGTVNAIGGRGGLSRHN